MDMDLIVFLLIVLGFAVGPLFLAWPLKLKFGNWPGMIAVALIFGALGYWWIADFGATLGVWALLLAFFVDPHAGVLRRKTRRRLLQTPVSLISQAPAEGWVAVEGRVVADGDTLPVPLAGGQCVWLQVQIEAQHSERVGKHTRREWRTEFQQPQTRPFHLEDGSGRKARIEVMDPTPLVYAHTHTVGLFNSPSEPLQALLKACKVPWTAEFGINRALRIRIEALRVGEPAYAAGFAEREPSSNALLLRGPLCGSGGRSAMLKHFPWWRML
jgi:hypothetical protein